MGIEPATSMFKHMYKLHYVINMHVVQVITLQMEGGVIPTRQWVKITKTTGNATVDLEIFVL